MMTTTLPGTTPTMNASDTPRHMNVVGVTESPIIAQLLTASTANGTAVVATRLIHGR